MSMKIRNGLAGKSWSSAEVYFKPRNDPGRKAPKPIDLAWLTTKAREWADARARMTRARDCRCTGRCECE